MNDFKDQLDTAEADKLKAKITELREALAMAEGLKSDDIRQKTGDLQQASLNLFKLVYEQKAKQQNDSSSSSSTGEAKEAEYTDGSEEKK